MTLTSLTNHDHAAMQGRTAVVLALSRAVETEVDSLLVLPSRLTRIARGRSECP